MKKPRLSWQVAGEQRGARQSAYQVIAEGESGLLWDSGKVESEQSVHVDYHGPSLTSGERVEWKVRVWDERGGASVLSETARFEMGLLKREDWKGKWIGSSLTGGARTSAPSPFLRKSFACEKEIRAARLYVTALGLYEVSINGKRVGHDWLTPGWTDYAKRVMYQTFDVGEQVKQGENVIGAILGDGWYCGYVANLNRQNYGDRPKLLAQLMIRYTDGSSACVASDESWKTSSGPILESDLIMGESYDARLELPGWDQVGYIDTRWQAVTVFGDPGMALTAKSNPPVRIQEEIVPVGEARPNGEGGWIVDMGQNMVGRVRVKVSAAKGTTLRLRYAEALKPNGNLYTESLRSARATDYYTSKGEGVEVYEPCFTFHGFRYFEISGVAEKPTRESVTGVVMHSDTPETGTFTCSDDLLNQLQHNIIWSQKGNFIEVPTDCPQRDERLGWTGDAQVFIRTATFNKDVAAFFTKWQQDVADSQSAIGQIPPVIPRVAPFGLTGDGGPAWADAGIICPWTIYQAYGDQRILAEHYESMRAFVDYLVASSVDLIRVHPKTDWKDGNWPGFGDWLSTRAETPNDLIGTAFFAYSAGLLSKIAGVLGNREDEASYLELAGRVREAFINRYVTRDGLVASMTQTAYVLGLYFDLIPAQLREAAVEELARDIEKRDWHLSTGFVGTPYLLQTLTRAGKIDVAYKLLYQKSWPSWLYPVTQGATTIWERWDGWTDDKGFQDVGMNSFNHYAYGAVGAWLYATVAGIEIDPLQPGYKHILLSPKPDGSLSWVKATYQSVYGEIQSAWRLSEDEFCWDVVVPGNTTAEARIPLMPGNGGMVYEGEVPAEKAEGVTFVQKNAKEAVYNLSAGRYHFKVK